MKDLNPGGAIRPFSGRDWNGGEERAMGEI